jgi:tryptophanase
VRLAIPRRVYTQSHIDYVIECFEDIVERTSELPGYAITHEPEQLRHFTAHFAPINA